MEELGVEPESAIENSDGVATELLPEPAIRRAAAAELSVDQLSRKREIDRWIAARYKGLRIVDTVETYGGDIIDYVDPSSVEGSEVEPPPRPSAEEMALPPGVSLQRTEVEEHAELRGPAGSIAMIRPRFDRYLSGQSEAKSLKAHLTALFERERAVGREEIVSPRLEGGQPAGRNRLYGGYISFRENTNVVAWVNEFGGAIDSGTFSLMETATVCAGVNPATELELVGATVSRDRANWNDSTPRIRVEFFTRGATATGDNVGGWDGLVSGFVPAAGRPYGPGAAVTVSTIGGAQFESRFEIRLTGGNWWIGHNGNWLGYYPGKLFNLINKTSCQAHWYGEVFDPSPASWTNTNMGSGRFASEGYGKAAYYRDPFYVDAAGVAHWPENTLVVPTVDSRCYSTGALQSAAAPWERSFFLGGPGGEAAGCD